MCVCVCVCVCVRVVCVHVCVCVCVCTLTIKSQPIPWPLLASLHDFALLEVDDTILFIKLHRVESKQLEPQKAERLLTITTPSQRKGREIVKVVAV